MTGGEVDQFATTEHVKSERERTTTFAKASNISLTLELEKPFTKKDLGRPVTRKTTKIIREGKAVIAPKGEMKAPMHCQLIDFINKFPETID